MQTITHSFRIVPRRLDLEVGIIYTHERQWMHRLLASIAGSADGLDTGMILVDNASANGLEPWEDYFTNTLVLQNPERLGYAANLNRILAASTARYVLLINTDLFFDPQERCLTQMVEFMDRHPECGIAGCRVYHEDGSSAYSARRFQTLRVLLSRRFGLGRWMPRTLEQYFYGDRPVNGQWECDWVSGCFMLMRRKAVEEVGLFDTGFVKYFEDVDMCLRMARAGWTPMYNGQTYCYHVERRASKNLISLDAWKHARSYLRWLTKWGLAPAATLPPVAAKLRRAA